MNASDIAIISGILFSCYGVGWAMGFLFYSTKRAIEKLM